MSHIALLCYTYLYHNHASYEYTHIIINTIINVLCHTLLCYTYLYHNHASFEYTHIIINTIINVLCHTFLCYTYLYHSHAFYEYTHIIINTIINVLCHTLLCFILIYIITTHPTNTHTRIYILSLTTFAMHVFIQHPNGQTSWYHIYCNDFLY